MQNQKLWTKNYIAITLISFFLGIIFFLLMSTIGLYVSEQFGVAASIAGLSASIFIISSSFARVGTGRIMAKSNGQKVLLAGLIFCLLTTALYFTVKNVTVLLIVRFLHGIGAGIATTATGTMIAFVIPQSRRAEGIGNFMSSGMLASAIGPFIGILLSKSGSLKSIYIICFALGIICLIINFFIKMPEITKTENYEPIKKQRQIIINFSEIFEKKALPISILIILTCISYSSIMTYLPMYAKAINMADIASIYFIFHAAGAIFTRPFIGRLMDRKGANIVSYPVLIIFAIGMFIVSRAEVPFVLLIGAAFIGLGFGNMNSIGQTIAIQNLPSNRIGMATSTFYIFLDLGLGIGPYILGLLIPVIGFRGIYLFSFFVLLISIAVYYFLLGAKERSLKKLNIKESET
ncbi:MAG: MFS transporter [Eubacteriaceae bacterium]|nr:MFS transporter [Eubacteriaceae bacterium]